MRDSCALAATRWMAGQLHGRSFFTENVCVMASREEWTCSEDREFASRLGEKVTAIEESLDGPGHAGGTKRMKREEKIRARRKFHNNHKHADTMLSCARRERSAHTSPPPPPPLPIPIPLPKSPAPAENPPPPPGEEERERERWRKRSRRRERDRAVGPSAPAGFNFQVELRVGLGPSPETRRVLGLSAGAGAGA
ncbi:hypothetical protein Mp_7g10630 [Marchantia polymorpha subsp. ruderalis]|uniref:Uncharacterized protein n=2 Tax=Marchantia polymorpha TaxID=3197 RepID=A0AAF6BY58_MARPO|nr:hypothetical protein MARPO_0316s0002 [Marchantia polymorpha]BBN16942.1 hypothetical protein Mp_7g10630 [Marchantia polymorpha subsp. ruderalis]|eukprot:PTQ26841.1 hypothetical protein MARPO_0316s0002 [Marchantia polymorpha]